MEDLRTFKKMAVSLSKNQQQEKEEMGKLKDINSFSQKLQLNANSIGPTKIVNMNPVINAVSHKWQHKNITFSQEPTVQARAPALKAWIERDNINKPAYFSKYDIKLVFPRYSSWEYDAYLKNLDVTWTRDETDYLLEQLEIFEGNFIVIADRWDDSRFPKRSVEDLKERSLQVFKKLAEQQNSRDFQVLKTINYDKQTEIFRKLRTEKFSARTENIHKQEEHLVMELKNLELLIKKKEKENKEFQKLIEFSKEEKIEVGDPASGLSETLRLENYITPGSTEPFAYNRGALIRGSIPNLPPLTNKKIELALTQLEIPENLFATETNLRLMEQLKLSLVRLFSLNIAFNQKQEELNSLKDTQTFISTEVIGKAEKTKTIEKQTFSLPKRIKEE